MSTHVIERETLVELTTDVAGSARDLIAAHGDLLRAEVREGATQAATAAGLVVAGGVAMVIGVAFAMVAAVQALQAYFGLTPAAAWGLSAVALLLVGGVCLIVARYLVRRVELIPRRTLQSLQESLPWLRQR